MVTCLPLLAGATTSGGEHPIRSLASAASVRITKSHLAEFAKFTDPQNELLAAVAQSALDAHHKLDALAAESIALKEFIKKDCCVYRSGMVVNAEAYIPETPATEAILNVLRAHAITAALSDCTDHCDTDFVMDAYDFSYEIAESRSAGATDLRNELASYAAHLRASAGKDGE